MSSPPPLRLITFGAPTARLSGEVPPPDVLWRKHLASAHLSGPFPGMTRSREHLLGLLWPDKDDAKARHSLNEALRRLRVSLGSERIITETDSVRLAPGNLEIDALVVSGAARPSGVFLEGFNLDDAPAFEEWVESARTRFRTQATHSFVEAAQELLALGKTTEALEAARHALGLEPYSEPAIRLAMRAAALGGDASGALREFHRFAEGLGSWRSGRVPNSLRWLSESGRGGGSTPPGSRSTSRSLWGGPGHCRSWLAGSLPGRAERPCSSRASRGSERPGCSAKRYCDWRLRVPPHALPARSRRTRPYRGALSGAWSGADC